MGDQINQGMDSLMKEMPVKASSSATPVAGKKTGKSLRNAGAAGVRFEPPVLAQENLFLQMLCRERKRAERSGKSFILMLLDAESLFQGPQMEKTLPKIVGALGVSMRETDTAGWYKGDSVLGVIFSEIGEDSAAACAAIREKVTAALKENLTAQQHRQICLFLELFPEDWDGEKPSRSFNSRVYPDVFGPEDKKKLPRVFKRALDLAGALSAVLVFSLLFLAIAAAIRLNSKGPVLFRQKRIGQFGAPFTFLKFRSMYVSNDESLHKEYVKSLIAGKAEAMPSSENSDGIYKLTQDPRVTSVGRFLRKTSLDELPQFFNVLLGEMSLVGPRPPIPYEVEAYDIWHRRRVLEAKPGITGLWQVYGRSRTNFDDMVRLDLQYVRTWTIWLDLKILLKTPGAMFSGDGAY
jgi:lipopolysaccharide/colanic/teichoic acid biosynthesis glycosyltransferase